LLDASRHLKFLLYALTFGYCLLELLLKQLA
jgi:hypothetical protein